MSLLHRQSFFGSGGYEFAPVLTGLVANYNVNTAAIAAGWDGVRPLIARITVSVGCVVYGSVDLAGAAAMWVPDTFPVNSSITIVRLGTIIGRGGLGTGAVGRNGLRLQYPTRLEGVGLIASGGGAGGEGQTVTVKSNVSSAEYTGFGGNPGYGAGYNGSVVPSAGNNGSTSGASDQSVTGGRGGDGGGPGRGGAPGSGGSWSGPVSPLSSSGPYAGGASGVAVVGIEYATFANGEAGNIAGSVTYGSNSYIATPTATPGSIGASFQGGYYGGLVWQPCAHSSTATSVAPTGSQMTLFCPEMVGNPVVYGGQTLRFVSQSDPTKFAQGAVVGAANGVVTIEVASVSGTGESFDAWTVTSQYRLIWAPKDAGETTLAVTTGSFPTAAWSLNAPVSVGNAMRAAGDATVFPIAHWAASLSIGGYTDWEAPTRDVLEVIFRRGKPYSGSNYAVSDRANAPSNTYGRDGSLADVSASNGVNGNSIPLGAAYTTITPSQVSGGVFRSGQPQAFDAVLYGTTTAYDVNTVWAQSFDPATTYGRQYTISKTTAVRVRAVRRSII